MLQNITFSAEMTLIQKAKQQAVTTKTTLNTLFRRWLEQYVGQSGSENDFDELMNNLSYVESNGKISRDEMNER